MPKKRHSGEGRSRHYGSHEPSFDEVLETDGGEEIRITAIAGAISIFPNERTDEADYVLTEDDAEELADMLLDARRASRRRQR